MAERIIYKYPLEKLRVNVLTVPKGATFLSVQVQHEKPVVWALVDPHAPEERRTVFSVMTGQSMAPAPPGPFLGTTQHAGGTFILHHFVSPAPAGPEG